VDTVKQPGKNWHPDSDIVATPQLAKKLGLGRTPFDDIAEGKVDATPEELAEAKSILTEISDRS
jgi:hypothetical protein